MFIRRLSIKNFKIHRDTSLKLCPITVFVGPNSGGKSAIFDTLINFSVACRGDLAGSLGSDGDIGLRQAELVMGGYPYQPSS